MTIIDEYVAKANSALRSNDAAIIDKTAREIVSAFNAEIPNLSHYRGQRSIDAPREHSASDLKKLVGKLRVLQEGKDRELYGQYGLTAISDSIRQLESAISENSSQDQYKELFNKIDYIYVNKYDSYVDGLCGWMYNDDAPDEKQATLRLEKLRVIRDEELRKIRIAESQNTQISLTQNQEATAIATSIAVASLLETCERIDSIPSDKLNEEDKDHLKGLLTSLDQAFSKDKPDKKSRLSKVISFLADKGADAFIAAAPFIWNLIQSM